MRNIATISIIGHKPAIKHAKANISCVSKLWCTKRGERIKKEDEPGGTSDRHPQTRVPFYMQACRAHVPPVNAGRRRVCTRQMSRPKAQQAGLSCWQAGLMCWQARRRGRVCDLLAVMAVRLRVGRPDYALFRTHPLARARSIPIRRGDLHLATREFVKAKDMYDVISNMACPVAAHTSFLLGIEVRQ